MPAKWAMSFIICSDLTSRQNAAQIPVWYKWVYWGVNPISYAQTAMAINEFGAPRWQSQTLPDGRTIGNAILDARC